MPSAVTAMCFNWNGSELAVARSDGNISLIDVANSWVCSKVLVVPGEYNVKNLCWIGKGSAARLFSAGLHGRLSEWNCTELREINWTDSYGGAVWSLSASPSGRLLALGCEDSTVRLFTLEPDSPPTYHTSLSLQKGIAVSLAWADETVLFAGSTDGSIRRFQVEKGRANLRIRLDRETARPIVWSLAVLKDGTLASGDSNGRVQIWNTLSGTLEQSLNTHHADITALTTGLVFFDN